MNLACALPSVPTICLDATRRVAERLSADGRWRSSFSCGLRHTSAPVPRRAKMTWSLARLSGNTHVLFRVALTVLVLRVQLRFEFDHRRVMTSRPQDVQGAIQREDLGRILYATWSLRFAGAERERTRQTDTDMETRHPVPRERERDGALSGRRLTRARKGNWPLRF
jgi:hypothetical protein